jgi:hypothetical protein
MNSLWEWSDWARDVFGEQTLREAIERPAIVHFEGPSVCKPWHYLCNHAWRDRYRLTLARTPWAVTPLEDQTFSTRLIGRLPTRWRMPAYWELHRTRKRLNRMRSVVGR